MSNLGRVFHNSRIPKDEGMFVVDLSQQVISKEVMKGHNADLQHTVLRLSLR